MKKEKKILAAVVFSRKAAIIERTQRRETRNSSLFSLSALSLSPSLALSSP